MKAVLVFAHGDVGVLEGVVLVGIDVDVVDCVPIRIVCAHGRALAGSSEIRIDGGLDLSGNGVEKAFNDVAP